MTATSNAMKVTTPTDTEIVMTREFNAPRDLVFEAHTSAEHMKNWWGPRQYEIAECEVDFRVGGKWRVVHRGSDGEFAFRGEYKEIVPNEKITWTFEFEGWPGQVSVETMTFEERGDKTVLTGTSRFDTKEQRDAMIESGMESGAIETWERLEEYAQSLANSR